MNSVPGQAARILIHTFIPRDTGLGGMDSIGGGGVCFSSATSGRNCFS